MKTKFICLAAIGLLVAKLSIAQSVHIANDVTLSICGKGESKDTRSVTYTPDEIKNCDLKITTSDKNSKVTEFKLTIIAKDQPPFELQIKGNVIPEQYRAKILAASHTYLEYIKADLGNGAIKAMKSLSIQIAH